MTWLIGSGHIMTDPQSIHFVVSIISYIHSCWATGQFFLVPSLALCYLTYYHTRHLTCSNEFHAMTYTDFKCGEKRALVSEWYFVLSNFSCDIYNIKDSGQKRCPYWPCLAFSVEEGVLKSELTAGDLDATGVKDTLLKTNRKRHQAWDHCTKY